MPAIFNIPYGLYVITTNNSKYNGCISNTVIQVTSNPTKIAVTINKQNFTCSEIQSSKKFNVSILNNNTTFDLIKRFGFVSGKVENKFENFTGFDVSENNIPYILENVNSYMSASVVQEIDLGTHIMFIASVDKDVVLNDVETMTYSYYLKNVKPSIKPKKVCYVCSICGYVYDGDNMPDDFICPLCKHDKSAFEKQEVESKKEEKKVETIKEVIQEPTHKKYVCPMCGYESDSDDFDGKCPLCSAMLETKD